MGREREPDELRNVRIERGYTAMTPGSVLIEMGATMVLCTASVAKDVPRWMRGSGRGWVTAEYGMLPGSSQERIGRDRSREAGRTKEIERLIGRSLRAVTNLEAFGELVVTVDCDVLQADGGTRTAAITGGFVALHDAFSTLATAGRIATHPITEFLAAISVGIVDGLSVLDLDYADDVRADVDMNVVMTESGNFVEVQGTAERTPFSRGELDDLLGLAASGIEELIAAEKSLLLE